MFKRGGIYPVNLPHLKSEEKECCPCLVMSNNISNEFSPVVTILPLSFNSLDKIYDFETLIPAGESGMEKPAKISSHILITIDKTLVAGNRLGYLSKSVMAQVEKVLRVQLGLEENQVIPKERNNAS